MDTSYFSGNHPDHISLQACTSNKKIPDKKIKWTTIIKKSRTKANSHHFFNIKNKIKAALVTTIILVSTLFVAYNYSSTFQQRFLP